MSFFLSSGGLFEPNKPLVKQKEESTSGKNYFGLGNDGTYLFTSEDGGDIDRIDPKNGTISNITTLSNPQFGVTRDTVNEQWLTCYEDGNGDPYIGKYDDSWNKKNSISLGSIQPEGAGFNPVKENIWIINDDSPNQRAKEYDLNGNVQSGFDLPDYNFTGCTYENGNVWATSREEILRYEEDGSNKEQFTPSGWTNDYVSRGTTIFDNRYYWVVDTTYQDADLVKFK